MAFRLITGRFQHWSNACKKQFYEKRLHAVYTLQKDVCHNLWRAQTALIHYTRGPAEWLTLKPDTGVLTHLPLGDSGTRRPDTPCSGHRYFDEFTSRQLGLSRPTPLVSATLNWATSTNDAGSPQMSGAYQFDSRSSTHLQSPRNNARQPTRSKPYSAPHTNSRIFRVPVLLLKKIAITCYLTKIDVIV